MVQLKFLLPSVLGLSLLAVAVSKVPQELKGNRQDVLLQASHAVHDIAQRTTPAVVSITSISTPEIKANVKDHLGSTLMGIGSGVVIRPDGVILTNHHVVQNSERMTVIFDEKHKAKAHLIGGDTKTDLAVIQLDEPPKKPLPTLAFGDSDQLQVGDWAIAVGSPYGLSQTVTTGIISAMGRGRLGMLDIEDFIQTDAAINPGNSGGPLLNSQGQMIGLNTAIFSQSGGYSGIGFAIPSKIAKKVFEQIILDGRVIRGWLGMMAQDLDEDLAGYFKVATSHGALVSEIQPDGPASKASIQIGDVIVKYGANSIGSSSQLKSLVAETRAHSQIPVQIYRQGKIKELQILIREQPIAPSFRATQMAGQVAKSNRIKLHPDFGITVQDIPKEILKLFDTTPINGALIVDVTPGSPAFDAGLNAGDIILSANEHEIKSSKDFLTTVKKMKTSDLAVLYVQRGLDEKIFVPVKQSING